MSNPEIELALKNVLVDLADGIEILEQYITSYLGDYEFRGDGGDYKPRSEELIVMDDAIAGLIADDEFCDMIAQMVARQKMRRSLEGCR